MATKKDLVEAYSFSRRRLVTAFVSGAPGGREVEPARPGRMIIGGIALAVLLVAGAAIAGALGGRPAANWRDNGLITDERGALYVYLPEDAVSGEPRLRQVINVTSAQLILGAKKATEVPDKELAKEAKGPPIGILNAPSAPPFAAALINSGWTSCTGDGLGTKTVVSRRSSVTAAVDTGFLVKGAESDQLFLIAEAEGVGGVRRAHRYPLPARDDRLLTALNLSPNDEMVVSDRWLELFPPGGTLSAKGLDIPGWAQPVAGYPEGVRAGDWFTSGTRQFAVAEGGVVELTPFALAVLRETPLGGRKGRLPQEVAAPAALSIADGVPYASSLWPEDPVEDSASASSEICGVLETAPDSVPMVRLALAPQGQASPGDVAVGAHEVYVESTHGAVVRSANWDSSAGGTLHLVDDRGYAFPIPGDLELEQLGYDKVPAVVVPDVWLKLFKAGPELSEEAALCPPAVGDEKCQ